MTQPASTWSSGQAYETYVGRWSRAVARILVPALAVPPGAAWVDVGCGTGVVTTVVLEQAAPASVLGVDSSPAFVEMAAGNSAAPCRRTRRFWSFSIGPPGRRSQKTR